MSSGTMLSSKLCTKVLVGHSYSLHPNRLDLPAVFVVAKQMTKMAFVLNSQKNLLLSCHHNSRVQSKL